MNRARGRPLVAAEDRAALVFDRVRAFLTLHHLNADPAHYAFAHDVVCNPGGMLAQSVRSMTEGGIRMSARDIAALGGGPLAPSDATVATAAISDALPDARPDRLPDTLVAQTQLQVEGFTAMVRAMHAETADFGRDLAASATALRGGAHGDDLLRLTAVMLARVRAAEARLQEATSEADQLRAKLAEARGDARRDPLTELPNRRAFEEAYAEHRSRSARLCLAICDIDRFKRVNDQFGHAVGDRVLKAIATALRKGCPGQFVARHGGEEFTILFADMDVARAHALLDSARRAITAKRYRLRESDTPLGAVTVSAGLVAAKRGEPLASVFARADHLLYVAKHDGRNQIRQA